MVSTPNMPFSVAAACKSAPIDPTYDAANRRSSLLIIKSRAPVESPVTIRAGALATILGQEAKIPNLKNLTPSWTSKQHPRVDEAHAAINELLKK